MDKKIEELEKRIQALEVKKLLLKTDSDIDHHIQRLKERKSDLERNLSKTYQGKEQIQQ